MPPRRALVLRPEPGATRTCAALAAAGVEASALPLFETRAVAWTAPDPARFDALLLTSANAPRHAGTALDTLSVLPVVAVGAATAAAARAAGLRIAHVGTGNARDSVAGAPHFSRLLHLAGRDRIDVPDVTAITVYASEARPEAADALEMASSGAVVLLHSVRAATHFAARIAQKRRSGTRIAALSAAVAAAAGDGWGATAIAPAPTDAALVATAVRLAIDP
ncbi:hypothetical protein COA17_09760 [Sphingomonas ginsenosidimutans]|jgi:uroporphyrinogen-III synthase|uniref:Tetrapyrrole biosynthesis uroporphyrinogen III synthase domain-containing protein n=1 Tax=Sphingomonas ginsenosidimutans TaxID=862134 RepID=A0A2A4HXR5_9SPHN|nr:uroporphyrinogen-III synthase [Sphingomonas ginsenosidimutans]PCG09160.1 hypothetical protein COA17_09760 [Sphingomonas ginsenosidimutans]